MMAHDAARRFRVCLFAAVSLLAAGAASGETAAPGYQISQTVPLGAPDKWDYLQFDPVSHRLFVAHGSEVTVLDGRSGGIVGRVEGLAGVHGIALVPGSGRGYATNDGRATAFDLDGLGRLGDVPTNSGADAVIADTATNRVFVMNGKGRDITVIDPERNTVLATVALGGKPEFAAIDGKGALFVNIEDTAEVVRVDTVGLKITARWPIPRCRSPHGLAIDAAGRRLFAGCVNARLLVVDADTGREVAVLPIGRGSDAVVFDAKRRIVFSSNGDGTLSRIAVSGADTYTALPPVPTAVGARTMALDPETGRLFLVTAEPDADESAAPRRKFVPGTVKLLVLDPQ